MPRELAVQGFLRRSAQGSDSLVGLAQLNSLGIHIKQHSRFPELYHFSYDQLESPKDNPIVQECRGLILNSTADWEVVAYPFKRFANYGEAWAAPVDWSSICVQEKVDGSLMVVWFYKGEWHVSTKGSPDAGGKVGGWDFTFSDLFWNTLKRYSVDPDLCFVYHYTYMIELTSIYNRVVCAYGTDPALTLIGVRCITSEGYPEIPPWTVNCGIPAVKEYALTSASGIEAAARALDPMKNEGFVVVDSKFNRVKIKSPSYVMIHHMKENLSPRRVIRLIQLGETSEVLSYFPEYQGLFDEIVGKIDALIAEIEAEYDKIRHLTDRKEFALCAQKSKHSGVLFALFLGKAQSVRDYILHSKKTVKKATVTEPAVEDFAFTEQKIEEMLGLKVASALEAARKAVADAA